jgi:HAD superfamily phosphoserine phosphatase-like hydrolase
MSADSKTIGRVAAFFDLDGTLIPEPSLEQRFFRELRRSGAIPFSNYLRWGVHALRLLPRGLLVVQHHNKRYLAGVCSDLVFRHMESISFFEEGIARVAWHARQGHEIVLVSGTLQALARLAATALECELEARGVLVRPRVCATRLAEERGRWTGHVADEGMYGAAKARAIEELAKLGKVDLRQCYAYGNSLLDRQLLCAVGHGHAVNPGKELAALANEKDWPIWHWHQEKKLDSKLNPRFGTGIPQTEEQA